MPFLPSFRAARVRSAGMWVAFMAVLQVVAASAARSEEAVEVPATWTWSPWSLGMSRDQVKAVEAAAPFEPVAVTGGLETRHGVFSGKPATYSFVFDDAGLQYIQLWAYEGKDYLQARQAALDVAALFYRDLGGLNPDLFEGPDGKPFEESLVPMIIDQTLGKAREMAKTLRKKQKAAMVMKFDMAPRRQPEGRRLHCQWIYVSRFDTYYVFLFEDRADAPPRQAEVNIQLEKL